MVRHNDNFYSCGELVYKPKDDLACSFGEHVLLKRMPCGIVLYNAYKLKASITIHQKALIETMKSLKKKPDLIVHCPKGLDYPGTGCDWYKEQISKLKLEMAFKGTTAKKNAHRQKLIDYYEHKYDVLKECLVLSRLITRDEGSIV